MNDNNYVRDIDLKELFFRILYCWRWIIVVALTFVIMCGGYKYISGIRTLNDKATIENQEAAYQDAQSVYETNKTLLQQGIENLKASLERQAEYNDKSILMQINPFDEQVANISFYVDTNYEIIPGLSYQNIDITDMVIRSYLSITQNGDMYNYILENLSFDIDLRYLEEIVTVWGEYNSDVISVRVINSDKTVCDEIIELARKYFEQAQDSIKEKVGEHSLTVINESSISIVDLYREKEQKKNFKTIEDDKEKLTGMQADLSTLAAPANSVTTNSLIIISTIKFAILGFLFGAFLIMGIIGILFMGSDKLSNTKELRERYSLRTFGILEKFSKKRLFGFIDRWLNKLEGTSVVKIAEDETIKRICTSLIAILKVEDIKNCSIMITGTAKIEKIESIYKKVSAEFSDKSYKFLYSGNISYTTKTIDMISECNAVIIVEEVGCSTYTEITKELENIKDLGKKVIGAVLI